MSIDETATKEILQRLAKSLTMEALEKEIEKYKGTLETFAKQANHSKIALAVYQNELNMWRRR